jgi:hypothetical protein
MNDPIEYIGFSGLVAIVLGIFGYGALHQRVTSLEDKDRSEQNSIAIARLEEQFKAMRSDIQEIKRAVVK